MQIDAYTARHTRKDAHPWLRLVVPVAALALTLALATACCDDRVTNAMPRPDDAARCALYSVDIATNVVERRSYLGVGERDASWR